MNNIVRRRRLQLLAIDRGRTVLVGHRTDEALNHEHRGEEREQQATNDHRSHATT